MSMGLRATGALFAILAIGTLSACNTGGNPAPAPGAARVSRTPAGRGAGGPHAPAVSPELRADYIAAVQARAGAGYRAEATVDGHVRAHNAAQGLEAELAADGVQLTAGSAGTASLVLAAFGCDGHRTAVRAAAPHADGNRVDYARGALREWYVNGPLGIEQGFTLDAPPACRAGEPGIVVELAVHGALHAELAAADRIELRDAGGRAVLAYADLLARDARGHTLPATLAADGDRLLLRVDDAGAAYPLQIDPLISAQQAKLLASDGADVALFGGAVAISGDTALIGASRDDARGTDAGAAYIFVRSGQTWTQRAKLTAADGASNDNFGVSVALSGDTALIGAMFHDDGASDAGAAYVFVKSGQAWTQQAKLLAADGQSADQLGISAALDGDTAVVGTVDDDDNGDRSGSAYVFTRSGTTWAQQAKLLPADGVAFDQFGISVAVSGDTVIVGSYGHDDNGSSAGSAYVFARSGAAWSQQAELLASDGEAGDQFGVSVAISGDTALIGANLDDDNGADSGSAYVFVRSGTTWSQVTKLLPATGAEGDNFGAAVALAGDTAVIGVPDDSALGAAAGAAYLFVRGGAGWAQQAKLFATDGAAIDLFGAVVALSGDTALIGAPGRDDLGSSSGAAYLFTPPPDPSNNGESCSTSAECSSGYCTDGVCCNSACGAGDPGSCQACSVAAGAAADGTCGPRTAGTVCRAAAGACDVAERCTGTTTTCPSNAMVTAGTVCRPATGACDVAERCTGSAPACPGDQLAPSTTVCRPAASSCDAAERCSGSSTTCPSDAYKPDLSLCRGDLLGLPGVCLIGTCVL